MNKSRSRVLLALSLVWVAACATSPPSGVGGTVVQGLLGSGGSAQGSLSDGAHWALSLRGSDVILQVDGAEVRFLDAAPQETLAYEHNIATATWRLQLASGVAVCRGPDLELRGSRYRLLDGVIYQFDREGSLVSRSER